MASNFKISTLMRDAKVNAATLRLDGGTGVGRIDVRTTAPPTNLTDASPGTLLATPLFGVTAFAASSAGVAAANGITSDPSAVAAGDAGHFRIYQGAAADTAAEWQGTAGDSGDTPDMEFDNKTIVIGGTVAISSMTYTQPIQ